MTMAKMVSWDLSFCWKLPGVTTMVWLPVQTSATQAMGLVHPISVRQSATVFSSDSRLGTATAIDPLASFRTHASFPHEVVCAPGGDGSWLIAMMVGLSRTWAVGTYRPNRWCQCEERT